MKPCKNLDYTEGKFGPDIELHYCAPPYQNVRFWLRSELWINNGKNEPRSPQNVQFCGAGRGRINGIFDCYTGEMSCYEPN